MLIRSIFLAAMMAVFHTGPSMAANAVEQEAEPPAQLLLSTDLSRRGEEQGADEQLQDGLVVYVALRRVDGPGALNPQGVQRYALNEDYAYFYEETCEVILVPEGFLSDFASIPPAARALFNPANYPESSLVHDWLYAVGSPGDSDAREKADKVFHAMLRESGIPLVEARTLFESVRAGGAEGFGLDTDFQFYDFSRSRVVQGRNRPENPYQPLEDASDEIKARFELEEQACSPNKL